MALKAGERVLGLPCGSPIARVPLPISCDVLPAREGSDAFPSVEKARVHHAARRRGSVVPLAAGAQQGERVRRIGVLMGGAESDPENRARLAAFLDGLQQLGWTDDRNVRIDIRWPAALSHIRG